MPQTRLVEMMQVFLTAAHSGDASSLMAWLREDVTLYCDGGGKRQAALRPVVGPMAVLKYMVGIYIKFAVGLFLSVNQINGEAPVMMHDQNAGLTDSVTFFSFEQGRLAAIYTTLPGWKYDLNLRLTPSRCRCRRKTTNRQHSRWQAESEYCW